MFQKTLVDNKNKWLCEERNSERKKKNKKWESLTGYGSTAPPGAKRTANNNNTLTLTLNPNILDTKNKTLVNFEPFLVQPQNNFLINT